MVSLQQLDQVRGPAIVLAPHGYGSSDGKTAHGLVRGSDRFRVLAVVDPDLAGQDAGEALDGQRRDIPVAGSVAAAIDAATQRAGTPPRFAIVGVATSGGRLGDALRPTLREAIRAGLSVVNGLHEYLADDIEWAGLAREHGVQLVDIRRPPPPGALHFWTGQIYQVRAPRVAVLGMDCSIGKRTTARLLTQALAEAGVRAEMIFTGQTGWLQGARYGVLLDALPNDFVSGELEHAIVTCDREVRPDVMLIEGQSALRNPSGPCGSELLLSAAAGGVILQHAPGRPFVEDFEHLQIRIPSVESEIALIRAYGVPVLALTLNGEGMAADALIREQERLGAALGLPVVRVLEERIAGLVPVIQQLIRD